MDTESPDARPSQYEQPAPAGASVDKTLFQSPNDALKAVRDDYLYWTGRLTDTSLQLSFAVIAANWAVFGTVDHILIRFWSKLSVALVIIGLGLSVAGAKWMGELHRRRVDYAASNPERWGDEFKTTLDTRDPWPFTDGIEFSGRVTRELKTWLPLLAGISFLIALVTR